MPTEKGARRQCTTVGSSRLRVAPRLRLGGTRRRVHGGTSPLQTTPWVRVRGSAPPCEGGRRKPLAGASPNLTYLRRGQGKGRWSRASIDPCSSLVYSVGRRVNSAAGERVGLDPRKRGTRRPVVTACYIDPTTLPQKHRPRCRGGAHGRAWRTAGCGCADAR